MRNNQPDHEPEPGQTQLPMALATLLGQVGCVTLVIVFAALGAGLWLDSQFNSRPLITLVLVLGSVPVTIFLMIRIVLTGMARIQSKADTERSQEDAGERTGSP